VARRTADLPAGARFTLTVADGQVSAQSNGTDSPG
jgi:hypothetical protein